jgi:hypothetical protein
MEKNKTAHPKRDILHIIWFGTLEGAQYGETAFVRMS